MLTDYDGGLIRGAGHSLWAALVGWGGGGEVVGMVSSGRHVHGQVSRHELAQGTRREPGVGRI